MKRRQFLQLSVAGATGLMCPTAVRAADALPVAILAHPHLLQIVRSESIVDDLGRRYCETAPAEGESQSLAQAILADLPPATKTSPLSARLQDQVRREFATGRTVILNGWILAVTEARQCALHSLLQA